MAIVVATPNVCEEFSEVTLKRPLSALDRQDSCLYLAKSRLPFRLTAKRYSQPPVSYRRRNVTRFEDAFDVDHDGLFLIAKRLEEIFDAHIGKLLVCNGND